MMEAVHELIFSDVDAAVAWAEENTTRDHYVQVKLLTRGGGHLSAEEIQDYAHTISLRLANLEPPLHGAVLRFLNAGIHVDGTRWADIAEAIAATLPETVGDQGHGLAMAALLARRNRHLFNRGMSAAKIARMLGVSRTTFYRHYMEPWKGMLEQLDGMAEDARKKMRGELASLGVALRRG